MQKPDVIQKNHLLDSLDLNTGMDALMKLQEVWGKNKKSKVVSNGDNKFQEKKENFI